MSVALAPHQCKAIGEIQNGSILKGGVGTGKTRTAIAYFYLKIIQANGVFNGKGTVREPRTPVDLYVITTAKKRNSKDWEREASNFRLSTDPEASLGGIRVVVDSWNNLARYVAVTGAFFIFDEQRLVGSGAWTKSFLKIARHNRWILLSATPGDTWMDYVPVFVGNGFYKNRTEFVRRHVLFAPYSKFPKITGYREENHLEKLRHSISVEMPYHRHTKRHVSTIVVRHDEEVLQRVLKKRWNVFEERPLRDVSELFAISRKVVNADAERLGAVMQLSEKHPRLIIFYNFNYELDALRTLGNTLNIPVAEWNGQKHEEIPDTEKWLYLVQYTAGAEGWNCTTTNATVYYSLNYSYKIFEQVQGRIDRMDTPFKDLYYYILRSDTWIDKAIWRAIVMKQNFNEKVYLEELGLAA